MIMNKFKKIVLVLLIFVSFDLLSGDDDDDIFVGTKRKLNFSSSSQISSPTKKQKTDDGTAKSKSSIGPHKNPSKKVDTSADESQDTSSEEEKTHSGDEEESEEEIRSHLLEISPTKTGKKNAVYGHFCDVEGEFNHIPPSVDRIDFTVLLNQELNDDDKLFYALREAEIKINEWVKNNQDFMQKTLYVGLAKNTEQRIKGHLRDCAEIEYDNDGDIIEANQKIKWMTTASGLGHTMRMSSLVYNIPEKYLPVVEVMVGELLDVRHKGTTVLGNHEAYEVLAQYHNSPKRLEKLPLVSSPKTPTQRRGDFVHSPVRFKKDGGMGYEGRKNVVYVQFKYENGDTSFIPKKEKRLYFSKLVPANKKITDKIFRGAMLKIEKKIRKWIQKNPDFFNKALYVGLAENSSHRALGHRQNLADIKEGETASLYEKSKKVKSIKDAWNEGSDVHMSEIVHEIPQKYLPVVEVLVGELLDARSKGNTLLGNKEAYDRVKLYFESSRRIKALKKAGLERVCEDLKEKKIAQTLGE